MRSVLFALGALFGVLGVLGFVIASVAGMAVAMGYLYIGLPLLAIPSRIAGMDIAASVANKTLCHNIISQGEGFRATDLVWLIGTILFLLMISGIYGGILTMVMGTYDATFKSHRNYGIDGRFGLLKSGIKLLIVGLASAIILGVLISYLYSTGVCLH